MTKKRLFLSLLGLTAAAALVWFGGPLLAIGGRAVLDGEIARLVVILVFVMTWTLVVLRRALVAKKTDEQIARGIGAATESKAISSDQYDATKPLHEQVGILEERFREAVDVLRSSRKSGATNLYELPWYVIIGPPGAGKTTVLANSGLRFPLAERFGTSPLRGVGGTRNCDWWFADEAVLLDTAGRYVTQDSDEAVDSAAWGAFLALLKRYRRRRPINGVLVAISLADVITQDSAERELHVRAIRQRIQEINISLGLRFPVYLMFTKSDLVAGFTDFFDDLTKEERGQVWGTTFEPDEADPGTAFAREYEALIGRLNGRLLSRLHQEGDSGRRGVLYGFPQQLATLKESIVGFVEEIAHATRYDDRPWVRGVYFTSGTQEGTPIDRLMGSIARTCGLDSRRLTANGAGRSYFISDLLQRVIFPEAELVGTNRRLERRRMWLHAFVYGTAACTIVATVAAWAASYARNQTAIGRVQERADAYEALAKKPLSPGATFDELLPRLDALRAITDVYRDDAAARRAFWEFGIYQGDRLGMAAGQAYLRELNRVFAPRVATRIAEHLRLAGRDTDRQYAALKAYVMLAQPQHLEPAFLEAWMQIDWDRDFAREPEKAKRLSAHLDAMLSGGIEPVSLDQELIKETRLGLNRLPLAQLVYGRLRRDALAADDNALLLRDLLGPAGVKVFTSRNGVAHERRVPGLYTYRGYYEVFLPRSKRLAETMRSESWVVDNDRSQLSAIELARLNEEVNALYFADYVQLWQGLLMDLQVASFQSPAHGLEVLALVSGRNSALRTVLQAVNQNTALTQLPGAAGKLADKLEGPLQKAKQELSGLLGSNGGSPKAERLALVPGAEVESKFADLAALIRVDKGGAAPIDAIIDQLAKLYAELDSASATEPSNSANKEDGVAARHIRELAVAQPQPVKDWLLQLAGNAAQSADKKQKDAAQKKRAEDKKTLLEKINAAWSAEVLPFCNEAVASRYPIDKLSSAEATPKDFGRLFAPGGLIDAFVKDNLKPLIDTTARPWKWRTAGEIDIGASNEALHQIEIAATIRDAYFRDGAQVPAVEFGLKPILLDKAAKQFTLDIGGQKFAYQHNAQPLQSARWPAPSGALEVSATFEGVEGKTESRTKEGPWALFRLLDEAKIDKVTADRLVATFRTESHSAQYEIRAASVANPFQQDAIERFRCPKKF
ncbi:MAG: type VI secretion system membrane subunit TssM [Sterolibacteriaceae bacterium]|nr:type VI secretion system membrane subunit TssM [Candidatus Methylophosphatis haderslevensis]